VGHATHNIALRGPHDNAASPSGTINALPADAQRIGANPCEVPTDDTTQRASRYVLLTALSCR